MRSLRIHCIPQRSALSFIWLAMCAISVLSLTPHCYSNDCIVSPNAEENSIFCQGLLEAPRRAACEKRDPGDRCYPGLTCNALGGCTCGNGRIDAGEQCDESAGSKGCTSDCRIRCTNDSSCTRLGHSTCQRPPSCDPSSARCQIGALIPALTPCNEGRGTCNDQGLCLDATDNDQDGFCEAGVDNNEDGFCREDDERRLDVFDCDDDDGSVNPGAEELCDDDLDNNCNQLTDGEDAACNPSSAETDDGDAVT